MIERALERRLERSIETTVERATAAPAYTGPLDLVPGAYSYSAMRALSSAMLWQPGYTVQKLDGGAEPTQSFSYDAVTGEIDSSAIQTFLDGEDGGITVARDHSGVADVVTIGQASDPKWTLSGDVARFTFDVAVTSSLASAAPVDVNSCTIFMVLVRPDINQDIDPFAVGSGPVFFRVRDATDGNVGAGMEGDTNTLDVVFEPPVWSGMQLVDGRLQFENNDIRNNGTSLTLVSDNSDGAPGPASGILHLGGQGNGVTWNGQIIEFLLYPSALSDANRLAIRQNIATYYGITLP